MKVLWTIGEGNVADVRRVLSDKRPLAYTTVMTLLDRLARKGGASRRKIGRSFVYSAVLTRETLRRLAVRDLVQCFFDGSPTALLEYLQNEDGHIPQESEAVDERAAVDERLDTALL